MRSEGVLLLFMFVGIPWTLGWITKLMLNHQRQMRILQLKGETASRLLDRYGSEPAVLEFLRMEAKDSLFDVTLPDTGMPSPYSRTLTAVQLAAFLLAAGAGCLIYRAYSPFAHFQPMWLFFGSMGLALGVGALVSAAAAFYAAQVWRRHRLAELETRS
jgi:hypothetical protein